MNFSNMFIRGSISVYNNGSWGDVPPVVDAGTPMGLRLDIVNQWDQGWPFDMVVTVYSFDFVPQTQEIESLYHNSSTRMEFFWTAESRREYKIFQVGVRIVPLMGGIPTDTLSVPFDKANDLVIGLAKAQPPIPPPPPGKKDISSLVLPAVIGGIVGIGVLLSKYGKKR